MMNQIKNEISRQEKSRDAYTENNARVHATTGKALLDMNFHVASYRGTMKNQLISDFTKAFADTPDLAAKWIFFARDIREGLGERDLFRRTFTSLLQLNDGAIDLIKYIPEYGRWDDWTVFWGLSKKVDAAIVEMVAAQLAEDTANMEKGKAVSICAKWMPSVNTSDKGVRNMGRALAKALNLTEKQYRKKLSALRAYLDVIEVKASKGDWANIDYEKVPTQANLKYRNAFKRNDMSRYNEYLAKLEKGEAKINASTAFPHDIVCQYAVTESMWDRSLASTEDAAIEAMWKALPTYDISNTLVVADGSGSMTMNLPGTKAMALDIANALAIYCSERNSGEFKDKYITFSDRPQFVDFSKAKSLLAKLKIALTHCEVASTDIVKVFKLILNAAKKNNMTQEEMVKNILIISDMEFNQGARLDMKLFDEIKAEYEDAGYKIPRCIFWNVNSRTGAVPMVENDLGVALVSGFSVHIAKMVMSGQLDPFECLKETLLSKRYEPIKLIG